MGNASEIYDKYFSNREVKYYGGGTSIYFINLGSKSAGWRNAVLARFKANRYGNGLGRRPRRSEREMKELKWCEAKHTHVLHFRRDMGRKMSHIKGDSSFVQWCG
jgi:hypothetical protein